MSEDEREHHARRVIAADLVPPDAGGPIGRAVLNSLRVRRVDSVSTQHRSFLLALLLPAFLLVSVFAVVQAQSAGSPAAKRWSDPATWPDKKVPAKDDVVTKIGRASCRERV